MEIHGLEVLYIRTNYPHAPSNPIYRPQMLPNFPFPYSHDHQTMPQVSPPPTSPTRAGQGQDWSSRQMQLWSQKTNWASRGLSISHDLVSDEVPPPPTSSAQTTWGWGDWTSRASSISQQLVSEVPTSRTSSTQTAGQYTDSASGTKHWSRDKGKGKKRPKK